MSQGAESNHSGQFLETAIEREFAARGVKIFNFNEKQHNGDLFEDCFLLRRVPYVSIYGCHAVSEFLYRDYRLQSDIRIECRWQQVAGSVDEKFPYFFANARHVPEKEVWLIVDGGGAKPAALAWLKRECAQYSAKAIRALSIPEARTRIKLLSVRMAA